MSQKPPRLSNSTSTTPELATDAATPPLPDSQPPDYPLPLKHLGRKRKIPLTYRFFSFRTREDRPLKKETLRVQHIRGLKYLMRCVLADRLPTRKALRIYPLYSAKGLIWDILKVIVKGELGVCQALANVEEGPATEGKSRSEREGKESYRSFNDEYCRQFYRHPAVRMIHFLYMQLVFDCGEISPEKLCEKLRIKCCDGDCHSDACLTGWDALSWYLTFTIIEDLGLTPYGAHSEKCSKHAPTLPHPLAVMGSDRLFVLHQDLKSGN